nr:alpha/beta hydrolase [uncultured Catonella sp.]
MDKETISFDSSDGKSKVAGYIYTENHVKPKAVIQLSHGMCEYIERYEWLADFFTGRGYVFAGNDHLGHGNSSAISEYGIFDEEHVEMDLKKMNDILREKYPLLPIILYGHSMGSFFARWYASRYPDTIDGLIISGTAGPAIINVIGRMLAGFIANTHKKGYVSKLLVKLSFGNYLKRIPDAKSFGDWLTHDRAVIDRYRADPKCNFKFSAKGYHSMLTALTVVSRKEWARSLPKDISILQIAGAEDPVGNYGVGVRKVTKLLKDAGIKDVTEYIDETGRHELHNEINKTEIMKKVVNWLDNRFS